MLLLLQRWMALICSLCCFAFAQSPQSPAFEVASVKISPAQTGRGSMRGGPGTADPGRISFTNVTLFNVILRAYDLKAYQLSAPDWLSSQRYDVTAQVPAGVSKAECNSMLQTLLNERFHMVLHHETKELQGFELVTGRGGSKLKKSSESGVPSAPAPSGPPKTDLAGYPELPGPGLVMMEGAKAGAVFVFLTARAQPLSALVELLSREFQMPISDQTGLNGNFDFKMEFAPQPPGALPAPPSPDRSPAPEEDAAPNLTTAVQQQLGLRLNSRKVPTDVLVVDRVGKVPTEN
uniref:Soil-associated protein, TIGR03435 family n=1 Tax=Solibacter usitatus (strain Ellin6076) TaxID=234267 RepID=Q01YR3_SOLUE